MLGDEQVAEMVSGVVVEDFPVDLRAVEAFPGGEVSRAHTRSPSPHLCGLLVSGHDDASHRDLRLHAVGLSVVAPELVGGAPDKLVRDAAGVAFPCSPFSPRGGELLAGSAGSVGPDRSDVDSGWLVRAARRSEPAGWLAEPWVRGR